MNNNTFKFKNNIIRTNSASNLSIQNFSKTYIESWVSNLNKTIDDDRLLFKYYTDSNVDHNIFYVILEIDKDKVLNIFRAESYNNIIWQYGLSNEFMNYILKKGKSYFYNVMKNYYEIVEIQMNMYLYYLKNNQCLSDMMNIIFIYNFFIKNNIAQKIITQFMYFVKTIKNSNTFFNNSLYKYFLSIVFTEEIKNTNNKNNKVSFSFEYELEFYFYFFCVDNSCFKQEYIEKINLNGLKKTIFSGKIVEFINSQSLSEKIKKETERKSSIKIPLNNEKMELLLNEKTINTSMNKFFQNKENKKIILKLFIDNGIRFGFAQFIMTFLLGDIDKGMNAKYKQTAENTEKASTLDVSLENNNIIVKSFIEREIIEAEKNINFGKYIASLNIDLTNNKIITTYEFIGVDKYFLLSNLITYDISSNNIPYPITIFEREKSNSTHEIIEYGQYILTPRPKPKILVFNFDETCEELLTDSFYVSTEKRSKKQIQQKVINDFIEKITNMKPAIVVVCTRNSISKTDKHYQHSIKDKILDLNKKSNINVNYFPLLKVDSTLQSNVRSVKLIGKTLCGIRTRVYVDQNQLFFKYRKKGLESYYGKGNELENTYEKNNSVTRVLSPQNKNNKNILSNRTTARTQIGSIIKYGVKRITDSSNKNKGSIIINLVLELNDKTKEQFIFCNYSPNTKIPSYSNFVANNSSNQSKIPDDKNIYICFLSNKISNENI